MSFLVFVSCDFELGRTWLTGGADRQSGVGLIFCLGLQKCMPSWRKCWLLDKQNCSASEGSTLHQSHSSGSLLPSPVPDHGPGPGLCQKTHMPSRFQKSVSTVGYTYQL